MLSIAHTLISLPFAFYLNNPLLIFIAGILGHLLADTLPHWNIYPDNFKKYPYLLVATDVIGGVLIAWLLLGQSLFTLPVLIAIAGGNSPDILHGFWDIFGIKKQKKYFAWAIPLFAFHDHLQVETKKVFPGLIAQIIFVAIALASINVM